MEISAISPELSNKFRNMSLLAAVLVVMQHAFSLSSVPQEGTFLWWYFQLFRVPITEIAVPYFYLAAGYFLAGHIAENGWWKQEVTKRIRSLLVPFFLWVLLAICVRCAGFMVMNVVAHKPIGHNISFDLSYFVHVQYFLRTLFLFVVLASPVAACIRRLKCMFIVFLFVCYLSLKVFFPNSDLLWYGISLHGLAYFSCGMYIRASPESCRLLNIRSKSSLIIALLLLTVLFWSICADHKTVHTIISTVIVPVCLIAVWQIVPSLTLPISLTSNAFPLYLIHPFCYYLLYGALQMLGIAHWPYTYPIVHFCVVLIVVVGCLCCSWIMRRFFPRGSALLFGGR